MPKRSEQKERRREEILKAGLYLFVRKGFAATKIADIAELVGMSIGLLYNYFGSTEVLYEALIDIALSARAGQYFPQYSGPLDYFAKGAKKLFDVIKAEPYVSEYFVLIDQAQRNPDLPQSIKDKLGQNDVVEKSIALIEEGQCEGMIREGNPVALALAFWLSIQGYIEMLALNPGMPYPDSDWFLSLLKPDNTSQNIDSF